MPTNHIVFGPIGAGKSTFARQLSQDENAICFSIDKWMVDLFGPDSPESLSLEWVMERVKRCEKRIFLTTIDIARNGGSVIFDLGFMTQASRKEIHGLMLQEGIDTKSYFIHASYNTRKSRVMARNEAKGETFALEISPAMFDFMDSQFETATPDELLMSIDVNTDEQC